MALRHLAKSATYDVVATLGTRAARDHIVQRRIVLADNVDAMIAEIILEAVKRTGCVDMRRVRCIARRERAQTQETGNVSP